MKKFVAVMSRAEEILTLIEGYVSGAMLLFVTLITSYFAIGRKFFETPPLGLDELARYMIPIIVMFGAGVAIRNRSHITAGGLELFVKDKKVLYYSQLGIDLFLVVTTLILTYAAWQRYAVVLAVPQKTTTLYIPFKYLELPVTVGITLWLLQFILQFFKDLVNKPD